MPRNRFSQPYQTTNATPVVAFKVPILQGTAAYITVDFIVTNANYDKAAAGSSDAAFCRASGGNVLRATGSNGLLDAAIKLAGNFSLSPKAEIIANTSTQTADIRLTGLAATTLNWAVTINVRKVSL